MDSEEIIELPPDLPPAYLVGPADYDAGNALHQAQWVAAGRPDLQALDASGMPWRPTITRVRQDDGLYVEIVPEPSAPVTDVEMARDYAKAYQAAQDIIFLLMGRVAPALVAGKHFTSETVNAEGSRFTRYHQAEIEAFKLAGRHPDAGDALYAAVEASAGIFPWLTANNELILGIFATTLPRNPK